MMYKKNQINRTIFLITGIVLVTLAVGLIVYLNLNQPAAESSSSSGTSFTAEVVKFPTTTNRDATQEYHLWLKVSFRNKNGEKTINPTGRIKLEGFVGRNYPGEENNILMRQAIKKTVNFPYILKVISAANQAATNQSTSNQARFFPPPAYVSPLNSPIGLFAFYNKDFFIHLKSGLKIPEVNYFLSLTAKYQEMSEKHEVTRELSQQLDLFKY